MLSYRLFMKYGIRSAKAPSDFNMAFCQNFVDTLVPALVDSHLQIVFKKKTHFVGTTALNYSLQFLSHACKHPQTMAQVGPYVDNLLFETAVPLILVTSRDAYLLNEEPVEFIRNQADSMFSTSSNVLNLVETICKFKNCKEETTPVHLHRFLEFCVGSLHQYEA